MCKKTLIYFSLILLLMIAIAVTVYFTILNTKTINDKSLTTIQKCVKEWETKNLKAGEDFIPGQILYKYKNTPIAEGTNIKKVNPGTEFLEICTLLENPEINYAEPNAIITAL